jgi:hypothetical protein
MRNLLIINRIGLEPTAAGSFIKPEIGGLMASRGLQAVGYWRCRLLTIDYRPFRVSKCELFFGRILSPTLPARGRTLAIRD